MPSVDELRTWLAEPPSGGLAVAPVDELIRRGRRRRWAYRSTVTAGVAAAVATLMVLVPQWAGLTRSDPAQPAQAPLALGRALSLRATTPGYSDQFLTVVNGVATLVPLNGDSVVERRAATFIARPGLADSHCFSFELGSAPGQYLRHYAFRVKSGPADGSSVFAGDATFCPGPGHDGRGTSFASFNYATRFLRHHDSQLWVASRGGALPSDTSHLWAEDTSWLVTAPLAD